MDGLTATLSGAYSIQAADVLGFTPAGFSGNIIYPNSINLADLTVSFSASLTDFSILYAAQDLNVASGSTMRVTGYMNGVFVGTSTTTTPEGTWPSATLSLISALGFNSVVIHYDKTPPNAGPEDYGTVFMADNMIVTLAPSAVPLPGALPLFATSLGVMGWLGWRRKRKNAAVLAAA